MLKVISRKLVKKALEMIRKMAEYEDDDEDEEDDDTEENETAETNENEEATE
jgi:hypothetical protein